MVRTLLYLIYMYLVLDAHAAAQPAGHGSGLRSTTADRDPRPPQPRNANRPRARLAHARSLESARLHAFPRAARRCELQARSGARRQALFLRRTIIKKESLFSLPLAVCVGHANRGSRARLQKCLHAHRRACVCAVRADRDPYTADPYSLQYVSSLGKLIKCCIEDNRPLAISRGWPKSVAQLSVPMVRRTEKLRALRVSLPSLT